MPHEVVYNDTDGIITGTVSGIVDAAVIRSILKESAELWMVNNCIRWLNDLSRAEDRLTTMDIYELPKFMDGLRRSTGVPIYAVRIAVVVPQRTDKHHFAEMVGSNRGQNIRVFQDFTAAREWLLNREMQHNPISSLR